MDGLTIYILILIAIIVIYIIEQEISPRFGKANGKVVLWYGNTSDRNYIILF